VGFGRITVSGTEVHDHMIAHTSQLAHIVSNSYVKSPVSANYAGFSGGSYKDMTRIACLDERVWKELFIWNKAAILPEIDDLIGNMRNLRDAIEREDYDELEALLRAGREAKERIDAAVYNSTKNVISSMTQDEVIEARDEGLTDLITDDANTAMSEYGIVITQSQIKALDLPDDNKEAVYQRMISERNNIAASYRAEGEAQAQKIRNETDRTVAVTKAQASKEADILIAEGEAEYMRILSGAYDTPEKADFYNFIRSLDALKESLKGQGQTIILGKDSELSKILYGLGLS
jgi:HflC protein